MCILWRSLIQIAYRAQAAKKAVSLIDDEAAGSDDLESDAEEGDVTNDSEEESVEAVEDIEPEEDTDDEVVVVEWVLCMVHESLNVLSNYQGS